LQSKVKEQSSSSSSPRFQLFVQLRIEALLLNKNEAEAIVESIAAEIGELFRRFPNCDALPHLSPPPHSLLTSKLTTCLPHILVQWPAAQCQHGQRPASG
jgi:hypothetical protein